MPDFISTYIVDLVQRLKVQDLKYYSIISYPYWFYTYWVYMDIIFCHKVNRADSIDYKIIIIDYRCEEKNDDKRVYHWV